MGAVYQATQLSLGRVVALKLLAPNLGEDPGFRARFAREVSAARKVGGLFTAAVVDADVEGPVPWLVTAYVPGNSLSDAVERQGPLPEASVLALAAGLAEGLNVMLNSDDPTMFRTDIGKEYVDFCGQNNYGQAVVRQLVLNGVEATWLDGPDKAALRKAFEAELDALEAELEAAP